MASGRRAMEFEVETAALPVVSNAVALLKRIGPQRRQILPPASAPALRPPTSPPTVGRRPSRSARRCTSTRIAQCHLIADRSRCLNFRHRRDSVRMHRRAIGLYCRARSDSGAMSGVVVSTYLRVRACLPSRCNGGAMGAREVSANQAVACNGEPGGRPILVPRNRADTRVSSRRALGPCEPEVRAERCWRTLGPRFAQGTVLWRAGVEE